MIEWDVLKIAMQHPRAGRVSRSTSWTTTTSRIPWLAAIRRRDGEGRRSGGRLRPVRRGWSPYAMPSATIRRPRWSSALAVDPLRLGREPDEQYAQALLARLQELTCARRIQDLKSKLQRTNPIDRADDYNRMFGELIALEAYRADLRKKAISGAL